MEFETGMSNDQRAIVSGALSKLLADCNVLFVKTQNFHYNIHAPEFYSLHKLSETHYEELGEVIDEIAERIRALGFFVDSSLSSFLKLSSIKELHEVQTRVKYLEDLIKAREVVIRECRHINDLAEKNKDPATIDMIGRQMNVHEKAAWMLRASL